MTRTPFAFPVALVVLVVAFASATRAEHLRPGDFAPFERDLSTTPPTLTPVGDGEVNITDVIVLLRAAIGLERIVHGGDSTVAELQARLESAEARLAEMERLLAGLSRNGDEILLEGANLRIANGTGRTESANGTGNLILGYAEPRGFLEDRRGGSHNLVLGVRSNYASWAGIVAGDGNSVSAPFACALGGSGNAASALGTVACGGEGNVADAAHAVVAGGFGNLASGAHACVSGGRGNEASGSGASVSGGAGNGATGDDASVAGGIGNEARGEGSSVAGGLARIASGEADAALGALNQDQ